MKKGLLSTLLMAFLVGAYSQEPDNQDAEALKIYRETPARINDLVHTKLDARFNFDKAWMYGKVWITLKPHFYPTDSLTLDAKGMDIKSVSLLSGQASTPLKFSYNGTNLQIRLNKTYRASEKYTVYIDYIAKPNDVKVKGSAAITDAKGLYFINPRGEEKNKPAQIWTQGETESTSVWCPTIDRSAQKCTDEITMTVPDKFVTLSNGKLVSQKKNADGTRTDSWKMELPHSPYLFFMGAGEYAIIKDSYKGKEVNYYVEKPFAPVARKIFGNTPEMIAFFSRITGVDFPWVKYSQIVGRDFVSGAMENTTATLHQESAQQDARELVDENKWEDVIAHELFHQWLGDYVTAESWSNLTLNESFADYSETLWNEYKYGKDAGDATNFAGMRGYLSNPGNAEKDLVRFHYNNREDMFDGVSYQKGGRILHMLRNYLGDSAFFKGLNLYLSTNKFKAAEAHHLRLAMEEVSGRDLNWFFNQWYYNNGHPKVTISYQYNDTTGLAQVIIKQTQDSSRLFQIPFAIDVYESGKKTRYQVTLANQTDSFRFAYKKRPDLINVDADKVLLWEKQENKSLGEYIYQYKHAGNYMDRREAIVYGATKQGDPSAQALLTEALKDSYHGLRILTLEKLDLKNAAIKTAAEKSISALAASDPKALVRAKAIEKLGKYDNKAYSAIFSKGIKDSSYSVAGASLEALAELDSAAAIAATKELAHQPVKNALLEAVTNVSAKNGIEEALAPINQAFGDMPLSQAKFEMLQSMSQLLSKAKDPAKVKEGVDLIVAFREEIPAAYRSQTDPFINNMILPIIEAAKTKENTPASLELANYIKAQREKGKKGF